MRVTETVSSSAQERQARAARRGLFIAPQSLQRTGGVETATNRVMEGLAERGWQVTWLIARIVAWDEAVMETSEGQPADLPAFLQDRRIEVVVNQHGFECAFTILYQRLRCAVPLINVFHSTPSGGGVSFNTSVWFRALRQERWKALGQPRPYYERVSVLLLTSVYEGWAMVLTAALQHGVVPVALDTFETVREIISHEETGLVLSTEPAALKTAAQRLMDDEALRLRLARQGPASARRWELDRIMDRWEALLEEVFAEA